MHNCADVSARKSALVRPHLHVSHTFFESNIFRFLGCGFFVYFVRHLRCAYFFLANNHQIGSISCTRVNSCFVFDSAWNWRTFWPDGRTSSAVPPGGVWCARGDVAGRPAGPAGQWGRSQAGSELCLEVGFQIFISKHMIEGFGLESWGFTGVSLFTFFSS